MSSWIEPGAAATAASGPGRPCHRARIRTGCPGTTGTAGQARQAVTIAGRAGAGCHKGNPSCIGVGLMRKLAKRFVVAITPEQYTSKTCCRCTGERGPHRTMRRGDGREIRGLRVCQNECCKLFTNRDKMGSINIATNFERLAAGKSPIRHLSNEEEELNQLQCSLCSE